MSWSVSAEGTKEEVLAKVTEQFDACARMYEGNDEQNDIIAAKERVLAAVPALEMEKYVTEGKTTKVRVSCYGSRSTIDGKPCSVQMVVNVDRIEV